MTRFSTDSIHGHDYYDLETGTFKVPLYLTTVFEHPDRRTGEARKSDRGFEQKYSREENPTVRAFEKIVAKLEKGSHALAFNSGMGGIAAVYLSALSAGDTMVITKESYGTTQDLALNLSKFGVKTVLAGPETEDFLEKIKPGVSIVLVETITNPKVRVVDVRKIAKLCKEVGARLVVDNTFATPILYRPLLDGAWMTLHSVTKYIGGHNDLLGGAIALNDSMDLVELWEFRRRLGSIMGAFEAFLALRGVSTLKVRFEAQSRNALAIAEFLEDHPKVEEVFYPGLKTSPSHKTARALFSENLYGGLLSFKIKGGRSEALEVLRKVQVIKPSPSLGGTESLLNYPITSASKTLSPAVRKELGIGDNLLRLALGLEDLEDLKEDLSQALSAI
ncbi:MAG: cystathionine gamma-synthase family protein [Thaumarchaeota archaeon]|nr:cystathionine gamma-synthase family protein [Nitrososphaerota archaeon]